MKMKKLIVPVLMLLIFAACQKAAKVTPKIPTTPKDTVVVAKYDTIPDGGIISVYVVKDSTYYNFAGFYFNHKYLLEAISSDGDVGYFGGFDPVQMYIISENDKHLEDDNVPYSRGMAFKLHIDCDENIPIFMKLHAYIKIPPSIHIWCKDNYLKDSVDLLHGAHYNFNIDHTIPASYSDDRFQVVLWADKKN